MNKQILSEEFQRMQKLAGIITEGVEIPTWLENKLEDVHTKPGQGSIFSKSIKDVLKLAQDTLDKSKDVDKIANNTGTLTIKSPGIGYNLVLPIEQAKKLPGAKESEVEKLEGPNKIKVPAITTSAPLTQFKSDGLTIIVRPKKDEAGTIIPNEYIVLSAFPGDPSIPRASEWGGKYAVIIPGGGGELIKIVTKMVSEKQVSQSFLTWLKTGGFYQKVLFALGYIMKKLGIDALMDKVKTAVSNQLQKVRDVIKGITGLGWLVNAINAFIRYLGPAPELKQGIDVVLNNVGVIGALRGFING